MSRLSVIVCTYNRSELLAGCLQSLVEQTLDADLFEVIIVNNNSTDNTVETAGPFTRAHHNFRMVTELNQGLSHARNRGFREATGDYVAYIDDDARATPHWCQLIVSSFLTVQPSPVAVGGKIIPIYVSTPPEWFDDSFETRTWGDAARFLSPDQARNGFSGSNMAFKRALLQEYAGFSPDLGMTGKVTGLGEETDFFRRLACDKPLLWYDPLIEVRHLTPQRNLTMVYRFKRGYYSGRAARFMERTPVSCAQFKIAMLLFAMPLVCAVRCIRSPRKWLTDVAFILQETGHKLGYLLASIK